MSLKRENYIYHISIRASKYNFDVSNVNVKKTGTTLYSVSYFLSTKNIKSFKSVKLEKICKPSVVMKIQIMFVATCCPKEFVFKKILFLCEIGCFHLLVESGVKLHNPLY
jgi:hypothetical protein